ncbi:MAG: imidazole glycerol phosphate synthase subunit HisF [Bacteroidetes bacterium 43-16]|nr:MAG: imidazole glycerol phosphate synthase subunit HisF [Bacteroidetes bacterium 43-16]
MLKKRIIPCLDINNGRTVKGIRFENLVDAGDPVALAKRYMEEGADELVFLDITATHERRTTLTEWVSLVAAAINIPFTVGGGIHSLATAARVIEAGADKLSINSAALANPDLISNIAAQFGTQCVTVAIDTDYIDGTWKVFSHGGRKATKWSAVDWAKAAEQCGAGEILLTSMQGDGTRFGFSLEITEAVAAAINIPVIASGGAGRPEDFAQVFTQTRATGALAASVFHFGSIAIPDLKQYLKSKNISIR